MNPPPLPSTDYVRFWFKGQIAGHKVEGWAQLPETNWNPVDGLRVLFVQLGKMTGLTLEAMERDASIIWTRETI